MKKFLRFFLVSVSMFVLLMAINMHRFQYGFDDGFWRTLMTPFEGTVWAPGFTEDKFNAVKS